MIQSTEHTLPAKLIMVGMRFRPHYAKSKPNMDEVVTLVREHTNDVNPNAIAVHFKNPSVMVHEDNKIGYIRDLDLPLLSWLKTDVTLAYVITRVCQNYLILKPKYPLIKIPSPLSDIFYKHHGSDIDFGINSVAEGPFPECDSYTNTKPTVVPNTLNPCAELYFPYNHEYVRNTTSAKQEINEALKEARTKQTTEKKTMINTNSMRDSFFKEVKNVALDMQSGKLGVITKDGVVISDGDGVSVNPITEMSFTIPAFAMRVPIADLQAGDIIITSGDPVFFREGSKAGYLTINTSGVMQEVGAVSNLFFGKNTVMAVKNMFGDSTSGMNPMLMAMMFSDKDGSGSSGFDFKKMMMMQMMMGNKDSGMGSFNPMMFMFMDKM